MHGSKSIVLLMITLSTLVEIGADECEFSVRKQSRKYFTKWIAIKDAMFARIDIRFNPDVNVSSTPDTMFPGEWMWTYVPPGGSGFYITWPVDYYVYSFGLLDTDSLDKTAILFMETSSANCSVKFGDPVTDLRIGKALYKMSKEEKFYKINPFYDYSNWCYLAVEKNFQNTLHYKLNQYLGVPLQQFGYKCCENYIEKNTSICNNSIAQWHSSQLLPFLLGLIFLAYFPFILMKIGYRSQSYGAPIGHASDYSRLDSDDESDYIFMRKRGPISLPKLGLSICGMGYKHPVLASRLRRAILVFLYPIVIYIFIYIFNMRGYSMIHAIVKYKIPFGFVSVLGGFKESMDLFLPMFGGPAVSLILYILIGLILGLIPRDLGLCLDYGLPKLRCTFSTLLKMDVSTIEKYSKINCQHPQGFRRIYSVMVGSLYMLMNPSFWAFALKFQIRRWEVFAESFFNRMSSCMKYLTIVPIYVIFVMICVLELIVLLCYNGVPLCFFTVFCIRGFTKCFQDFQRENYFIFNVILSILFPICCLFLIFMTMMITLQSFTIIGFFLYAIYLSLNIFPSRSFGFLYYVIMFIIYVCGLMNDFEEEYRNFLCYTIKACKKLQNATIAKHIFHSDASENKCCEAAFLFMTRKLPKEFLRASTSIQDCDDRVEYVRYKESIPGVRKELFQYVIDRYQPLHISVFRLFVQLFVVQTLLLMSIIFMSTTIKNLASKESSEVLNVMTVVIVTMIPNLIRRLFAKAHHKKVLKRKVQQRVYDFWKLKAQVVHI